MKKVGGWEIGEWNGDWILFVVAGVAVGLDLVVYGPRTSKGMMVRRMRGTCDVSSLSLFSFAGPVSSFFFSFFATILPDCCVCVLTKRWFSSFSR